MPSAPARQAKFDPIPPDLDLLALIENTSNFDCVIQINVEQIEELGMDEFEKLVLLHVIKGGKPLIVQGWDTKLHPWLFNAQWLIDNCGTKQEKVRDIGNGTDMPMTMAHYLRVMDRLTNQWTPSNFRDPRRQRLYLKDIDCPDGWFQQLEKVMPSLLFYLNESVGETGGPGATQERNVYGQPVMGRGIAPAGDLMSSLPPEMQAENMMCYIGHEGTYTPAHREMCASLGQNVMVETSDIDKGERPGSSIWFMTETKEREVVSEYFLSTLGHDIEVESHFAQINAWKKAPFKVYVHEQKVGDLILIPPLAPHQVWNRGARTMKAAWNRTTVETLELAIHEALPRARMVCRDEQYKNKAIIYYTLQKYFDLLKRVEDCNGDDLEGLVKLRRTFQLKRDFKKLHALYTEVLLTEMFSPDHPLEKNIEYLPFDSNVTCSYCRCNIFNRFLTCKTCIGDIEGSEEGDTYDVCMECFVMGRSCACISKLKWVEQWNWEELIQRHEEWREMVLDNDGYVDIDISPQTLDIARVRSRKKSVAQICQEQLKIRPWRDITKPPLLLETTPPGDSDVEPECDNEGRLKPRTGKKTRQKSSQSKKTAACHVCKKREWNWKLAFCSDCSQAYCYGVLWRAFDFMPQTIMENPNWKCPKCLKMCSCGRCRRDPIQASGAYRPKGTLLGHDTKKVADPRSVESLVDFSRPNRGWLRGEGDDDPQGSERMQNLMRRSEVEKSRIEALEEPSPNFRHRSNGESSSSRDDAMAIDPQLQDGTETGGTDGHSKRNGNTFHETKALGQAPVAHMIAEDFRTAEARYFAHHGQPPGGEDSDNHYTAAHDHSPLEPSYPDPMLQDVEREYNQQPNDDDRILYNASDSGSLGSQDPHLLYPKLHPGYLQPPKGSVKRKRDNAQQSKGRGDDAHAQFIQAQKKQKLDEARANNSYYKTSHQLEGGTPLIVKLPMSGEALTRIGHSKAQAHTTRGNIPAERDDLGISPVIVRSDVLGAQKEDESCEEEVNGHDSDDDEFTFSRGRVANARKPAKSRKGKKPGRPSRSSEPVQKMPAAKLTVISRRGGMFSRNSRLQSFDGAAEDEEDAATPATSITSPYWDAIPGSAGRTSAWLTRKNIANGELPATQSPKQKKASRRNVTFKDTSKKVFVPPVNEQGNDSDGMFVPEDTLVVGGQIDDSVGQFDPDGTSPPNEQEESSAGSFVAEDTPTSEIAPLEASSSPAARQPTEAELLAENRRAKMMAMRELEPGYDSAADEQPNGEYDSDTIVISPKVSRASTSKAAASPNVRGKATYALSSSKSPSRSPTLPAASEEPSSPDIPNHPRGKLLSLSERGGRRSKNVKIIAGKSKGGPAATREPIHSSTDTFHGSLTRSSKVAISVEASKMKNEPVEHRAESGSGIPTSDDDDDESILNVLPIKVRPNISLNDRGLLNAVRGRGRGRPRGRGRGRGRG